MAGKISDTLGISTARVAVLLRKMESKDLIGKEKRTHSFTDNKHNKIATQKCNNHYKNVASSG